MNPQLPRPRVRVSVTEVVGAAGVGKTQFCLTASVVAIANGQGECGVIYFDTEGSFSTERLLQIADARGVGRMAAARVRVYRPTCCKELMQQLAQLECLVVESRAKLIVLDSAAALVRKEFSRCVHLSLRACALYFVRGCCHSAPETALPPVVVAVPLPPSARACSAEIPERQAMLGKQSALLKHCAGPPPPAPGLPRPILPLSRSELCVFGSLTRGANCA